MALVFTKIENISRTDILTFAFMNDAELNRWIQEALKEDIGDGDHTTLATIPASAVGKARLLVKEDGVLAGMEAAKRIIEVFDSSMVFTPVLKDGDAIKKGDVAFYLEGKSQHITTVERLVLNVMQRMSGIATETHRLTELIKHTKCRILDTRKTTPLFRYFEKEAVRIGGGVNHRYALYDMILVKDNHVDFAGGMPQALSQIQSYLIAKKLTIKVEVEARNLEDVKHILDSGIAFRILLDNFTPQQIKEAVDFIDGRVQTEASGGINESTLVAYAETGVDFVSMGALTHHVSSLDLSLKAVL